jgi:hypothetical protein
MEIKTDPRFYFFEKKVKMSSWKRDSLLTTSITCEYSIPVGDGCMYNGRLLSIQYWPQVLSSLQHTGTLESEVGREKNWRWGRNAIVRQIGSDRRLWRAMVGMHVSEAHQAMMQRWCTWDACLNTQPAFTRSDFSSDGDDKCCGTTKNCTSSAVQFVISTTFRTSTTVHSISIEGYWYECFEQPQQQQGCNSFSQLWSNCQHDVVCEKVYTSLQLTRVPALMT